MRTRSRDRDLPDSVASGEVVAGSVMAELRHRKFWGGSAERRRQEREALGVALLPDHRRLELERRAKNGDRVAIVELWQRYRLRVFTEDEIRAYADRESAHQAAEKMIVSFHGNEQPEKEEVQDGMG